MSAVASLGLFNRGQWPRQLAAALGLALLAWLAWRLMQWGVLNAVFRPDAAACQALAHQGACWGVVPEKLRPMLLGFYPPEQQWRAVLALGLMLVGPVIMLWHWGRQPLPGGGAQGVRRAAWHRSWLLLCPLLAIVVLHGGVPGLPVVPVDAWGGLPLTLCLFLAALLCSVPVGIGLALARRARRAWLSWSATLIIELVRGVPLVTLLFMAAFLLPVLIPQEHTVPLFWRCLIALTLFSSVYLAEVVRAGLQTVAQEQREAAEILGLNWWQTQRLVVLPQALRAMLPALTGHAIGLLKDSSLVMVVGLHELTGGLSLSLGGDPLWRPYYFEAYLFVGLIYASLCMGLSRAGRWLELRWAKGTH